MLSTKQKTKIINKNQVHDKDTGSSEVQVALLTEQIEKLADHLKKNAKDNHSRRGLLKMVAKRRDHMKYIARKNKPETQAEDKK